MMILKRFSRNLQGMAPSASQYQVDTPLFFTILSLVIFGLIFTFSSSAFLADYYKKDTFYFLKRQALFIGAGTALMFVFIRYYNELRQKIDSVYLLYFTWFMLALVFAFKPIANVHRWIPCGPIQLQPSEFAKIALIYYIADYLDRAKSRVMKTSLSLVAPFTMTAITLVLIGAEPDLGTPILLLAVVFFMFYAAGAKLSALCKWAMLATPVIIIELFHHAYRMKRLMVFLSPEQQASEAGYQLSQSFLAVGSGGWFGAGLGASKMKMMYLPAPHTDFIFAIMAEELGLLRILCIIAFFLFFLSRGIRTAKLAEPFVNSMMALGFTLVIVLQAFINMAMSIGLLPTKGVPLPFFSYGGSSIIATLMMAGLVLGISSRRPSQQRSASAARRRL
jgi:cell division protein FtsW